MNLKNLKKLLNNKVELVFKELDIEYEIFNNNLYCKCPAHGDSDNPRGCSFSQTKGIWKCWTRDCQQEYGNDIFGLIAATLSHKVGKRLEFKDALKWSCRTLKINQEYNPTHKDENDDNIDEYFEIIKYLHQNKSERKDKPITEMPKISIPSEYFKSRGFSSRTLKYFDVGDCEDSGIMKDRAVIPIHNHEGGDVIGLIGRSTNAYRVPKFLIYPSGFDKNYYFYNYHRAIKRAKEKSCMFILEGQGDVWKMYEAGVKNAVSLLGKTVSNQHLVQLNSLPITKLVIIMDNDQAGRESSVKIKRDLGRMYQLFFPKLKTKDIGDMKVSDIKTQILSQVKGLY